MCGNSKIKRKHTSEQCYLKQYNSILYNEPIMAVDKMRVCL